MDKEYDLFTQFPFLVNERGTATYQSRHGRLQIFNGFETLWQFQADGETAWQDVDRHECCLDDPHAPAARCTHCGHEVDQETMDTCGLNACPNCHSTGIPCDPHQDVTIRINWHELRILVMWAERWASAKCLDDPNLVALPGKIAGRIEKQCPDLASKMPLTFLGEIKQVKADHGTVEQNVVIDPDDLKIPPMD